MKKAVVIALAAVLCLLILAGCVQKMVEPPAFTFLKAQNVMPVKQLVFEDGTGKLEDVGYVQETGVRFCLTGAYMNGTPTQNGDLYYYIVPEAFSTLRKRENVDGVLILNGVPYGAGVTDDGTEMIYTLDETLAAQNWLVFFNEALKAEK